jgi:type IV pilus assembly protein PilN
MIRINLLPVRATKKKEFTKQILLALALTVLVAVAANLFWWKQLSDDEEAIAKRIGSTQGEIAQLDKTIGEVNSLQSQRKAIEDKLKALDALRAGRMGPVKLMDELSSLIPVKVWLTSFSEASGAIALVGRAANYEELSVFSKKLKASKRFRDVVIRSASQGGDGIISWDITCRADFDA